MSLCGDVFYIQITKWYVNFGTTGSVRYTCNFITEYQGRTNPTMKSGIHIFSV